MDGRDEGIDELNTPLPLSYLASFRSSIIATIRASMILLPHEAGSSVCHVHQAVANGHHLEGACANGHHLEGACGGAHREMRATEDFGG